MLRIKEKKERALGVKLGLKPFRCSSPKCAATRRPQRPGVHGGKYRRQISEYGQQLREKQKLRFTYGLSERQLANAFKKEKKSGGSIGEMLINALERRLDNVVFRLGIAPSRSVARQLVSHGHIIVNGRKVTVPSYKVKVGDIVSIRPQSKDYSIFKDLPAKLERYDAPVWLQLDAKKMEGKVVSQPKDVDAPFDMNLIVDYYSK